MAGSAAKQFDCGTSLSRHCTECILFGLKYERRAEFRKLSNNLRIHVAHTYNVHSRIE